MTTVWEEIIVVGGEGGRITLLGSKEADGTWRFKKKSTEIALMDFFEEEDLSTLIHQQPKEVVDWEQALSLLGSFWTLLSPLYVHPKFKKLVWEKLSSLAGVTSSWEMICCNDK